MKSPEQLPDKVGQYLELGQLAHSPLIEGREARMALKIRQFEVFTSFTPDEYHGLIDYLTWRQEHFVLAQIRVSNGKG